MLLLAACSSGGGPDGPRAPEEGHILITGRLLAPNGVTPVSGATVTLSGATITGSSMTVRPAANGDCAAPAGDEPYACTGTDGAFELDVESAVGGSLTLKAVKGSWGTTFQVQLNGTVISVNDVRLATNPASGAPRIAVVQGSYDIIEDILVELGYSEFDTYYTEIPWAPLAERGTAQLFAPDENGTPRIFSYSIVFIACGSDEDTLLEPDFVDLIREYVDGGGRLYVSDLAYDVLERAFPQYIDFYGDDTERDAAQMGVAPPDAKLQAAVRDAGLAAWLAGQTCAGGSCINSASNTIEVGGLLDNWTVMLGAESGATVKEWVNASVPSHGTIPLTVSFTHGDGLVLFTSYHNAPEGWENELEPQRFVLQYLVFEL